MGNAFSAALLCLALLLAGCSQQVSEGPGKLGGGTETIGISGTAVDSSGEAVAGALVKLRRSDYLDTGSSVLSKLAVFLADVEADSDGTFFFGNVDTGAYLVEIVSDGHAAAVQCTVKTVDAAIELGQVQLAAAASIQGVIGRHPQLDSSRVQVFIYGLDRSAQTGAQGSFEFTGLAPGTYSLRFVATSPYGGYDTTGVTLAEGETNAMGSIGLPHKGLAMDAGDSVAVATILAQCGLSEVHVGDVVFVDPLSRRVVVLALSRRGILSLPPEIGELTALRELHADGDSLEALPAEIGSLVALQRLSLRQNRLASLPSALGELTGLQFLDLSQNQLTSLPGEIHKCVSLNKLLVSGNRLDALPDSLADCRLLQYLVLDGNRIASLPASFAGWHPELLMVSIDTNRLCALTFDESLWLDRYSIDRNWRTFQECN